VHKKPLPQGTTVQIAVHLSMYIRALCVECCGLTEPALACGAGKELTLSADIRVTLPGMEKAAAEALVAEAHKVCPYSKATVG
jgi:hypothetical protein